MLYCLKLRIILIIFKILVSSIHKSPSLTSYSISSLRSIFSEICTAISKFIWLSYWWKLTKSSSLVYKTIKIFFCNWPYIWNWFLSKMLMCTMYRTSRINRLNPVKISLLNKAASFILDNVKLNILDISTSQINWQLFWIIHHMLQNLLFFIISFYKSHRLCVVFLTIILIIL